MRLFVVTKGERKFIDILMIIGGIVGPLSVLPQIITIYSNQDAGAVSLISWGFFMLLALVGVAYTIIHKERILLIGYSLYFLADLSVVVGVLLYG